MSGTSMWINKQIVCKLRIKIYSHNFVGKCIINEYATKNSNNG